MQQPQLCGLELSTDMMGGVHKMTLQKGGDVRIWTVDSLCCAVEANTTSQSNYTPIKIN